MAEKHNQFDMAVKIILLGEVGTGKTSLINVYMKEKFNQDIDTTISPSFFSRLLNLDEKNVLVKMWDTAGQERFRSMNKIFIKESNVIIFVYDITRKKTLKELSFWTQYVESCLDKDNVVYGIVGNKIDLFDKEEELKSENIEYEFVNSEEGKEFSDKVGAKFLETSAKEKAPGFAKYIDKLVGEYIKIYNKKDKQNNDSFILDGNQSSSKVKCC